MNTLIFLSGCLALASSQFIPYNPYTSTTPDPTRPLWNGPLANHINGQLPPDTPEVAAAKAQHNSAHSQVLAVLPTLSPEIRYQKNGILLPQQPIPQQPQHLGHFPHNPQPINPQPAIHTSPQFTQFAEEIPRSPIGEVPEVHAARVAHLKAFEAARAALPRL